MLTTNKIELANQALQQACEKMNKRFRLGYHIMAPANWINDPNGLIQFNGEYHAFYQHHPYDEHWGPMHWGHVKSKDLVHWEHCSVALAPGDECDIDGCFSGSAVDNNGELTLIYTGHNYTDKDNDIFYQNQNIAVSTDGIHFTKVGENPVIAEPPEDSSHHFRDPKVWKHEDSWYMILGNSTKDNVGRVILYRSADLRKWEYVGVLAQSAGDLGFMWECPDFFELDGKHVLLFSPQGVEAKGDLYKNLFQTGYLIGEYDYETNKFVHGSFEELDHGHDFYAVQTLLDDKGRRIAIGWMDMWESNMPTKEDGWAGALTLPRVLTLGENNKLLMNPVEEAELLREAEHNVCTNQVISGSFTAETNSEMLEVKAVFDFTGSRPESVGLKIVGGQEETVLTYNTSNQKLILDCTKSGKPEDGVRSVTTEANGELVLRVFIDRSSIEVFTNNGQATLTSRIYPNESRTGIELFSEKGDVTVKELTYWTLKDIWE
ncbi:MULTISPECIES: glycoside hydrolase family 32 protein [Bacillus]|uniref:Sucrose-6-phosphate hydrolase n=2 Tax=Bacillus TaxID=1386 RepID=A0A0M4FJZ5_9BACI|nr:MULTISPECIES: glycoside hydrolase family 32 protein [Bacillus]ALC83549.1 sucrose-6-phosphate hydrolase [Bacillus gobiensis]MBP1082532.1 beta-fructofuranosidase [Bacillus capparidis]MED1097235.1 glycoside hydrolase family 32 protein [Bacillus capparidis]